MGEIDSKEEPMANSYIFVGIFAYSETRVRAPLISRLGIIESHF